MGNGYHIQVKEIISNRKFQTETDVSNKKRLKAYLSVSFIRTKFCLIDVRRILVPSVLGQHFIKIGKLKQTQTFVINFVGIHKTRILWESYIQLKLISVDESKMKLLNDPTDLVPL